MAKIILLLCFISLITLSVFCQKKEKVVKEYEDWKKCEQKIYSQPSIFRVNGQGSSSVRPTVGIVVLGISITSLEAADALLQANTLLNKAVTSIQLALTSNSNTTFSTSQLTILPKSELQFNKTLNQSVRVQVGYTVTNILSIRTKDLTLIGTIIDQGIKNGLNDVQSVSFALEPKEEQDLKESLIADAVKDAQARAQIALSAIGYNSTSIKSVQILDFTPPIRYERNFMALSSFANAPTQVFAGDQNINTNVQVGFVITKSQASNYI